MLQKMTGKYTNIQISEKNKHRLKMLALTPSESYENIILRLINVRLGNRSIIYKVLYDDISVECKVDWGSDELNIQWLNDNDDWVKELPTSFTGVSDDEWFDFRKYVLKRKSLVSNLSVLEYDEEIVLGDLVLKRIS